MDDRVKGLREARVAETEERILTAARRLFVRQGYRATTLADVADAARVAPRTVYLRFGTKAALVKRVTDVAVAGDTRAIDVAHRDWFQTALDAPTLTERINALARGTAELMERAGDLFEVIHQAESVEPTLAEAMQAGREATRENLHAFVRQAVADRLVRHRKRDIEWLQETVALLCQADTYLLLRRTTGWRTDQYRAWLVTTLGRVFQPAA